MFTPRICKSYHRGIFSPHRPLLQLLIYLVVKFQAKICTGSLFNIPGLQCHNDVKMQKQKCKQTILHCLAKNRFCILWRMRGSKFDNASANMAIKGIARKN